MSRSFSVLAPALLVLLADQATKITVKAVIPLWDGIVVLPGFFNLVHTVNKGAVFGFLNRHDISWQRWFFIAATLVAMALIGYLARSARRDDSLQLTSLGLILGGALGNLVDRIWLGHVIDFLDFYVGSYHWPAFNVADSAICMGAFLLLAALYRKPEKRDRPPAPKE